MNRPGRALAKLRGEEMRSEDEKLKRGSLQKGLNIETRLETTLTSTAVGSDVACLPDKEKDMEESSSLMVVGQSIQVDPSLTSRDSDSNLKENSNTDTPDNVRDELFLEEINDNDVIPEVMLPSAVTWTTPEVASNANNPAVISASAEASLAQRPKPSRLGRLRKRIRTLFSCFRRNQVTPVDS